MAAPTTPSTQLPSITLTWKEDPSAGPMPAHIHYPSAASSEDSHPIALIFHPGGFVLGTTALTPKNQIANLVSRGFVVVTPEYRLCPQVSLYDGPIQDAKDVYHWTQTSLPALLSQEKSIKLDTSRIVAMGHSAGGLLALTTGLCPNPPRAIVDFYGCKYLDDESWTKPLPKFAPIPEKPLDFINKIYDGPQALTSLPMFMNGKPTLSDPRCAWFIQQLKNGTSISSIVQDGDYERVDATKRFNKGFPPTYFLHGGDADVFINYRLSVRAHEELKEMGVETELVIGEEVGHVFDLMIEDTDPLFIKYVVPALEFLERHV
ncbi:Nn.00g075170.m01.CDS01 [Neocucurbitaria sp. VM-36]